MRTRMLAAAGTLLAVAACGANDTKTRATPNANIKVAASPAPLSRAVIRRTSLALRVRDVPAAARAAVAAAERAGGYLEAEQTRDGDTALTLRVPPARLTVATTAVEALGAVVERTVTTEDVTEAVADVEGRLAAATASTGRLRSLIARADSVGEIAAVEAELNRRESDLESLRARRRVLAGRTSYATLAVTLARTGTSIVGRVLLLFALATTLVLVGLLVLWRRRRPLADETG